MKKKKKKKKCLPVYHPFYYITWSLRFTGKILLGMFLLYFPMFSKLDPCLSSLDQSEHNNMAVTALTLYEC